MDRKRSVDLQVRKCFSIGQQLRGQTVGCERIGVEHFSRVAESSAPDRGTKRWALGWVLCLTKYKQQLKLALKLKVLIYK
jgi:hypothetical protein